MFMRPRVAQPAVRRPLGLGTSLVIGVSAAALLIFGIFPAGFVGLSSRSQPAVQTATRGSPPVAAARRQ
jgi:hypothetical protein